jgi:hypothetical protein
MTEDEAKTKACCGPPAVAAAAYYRAGVACDAPMHCIASACMAWRVRHQWLDNAQQEPSWVTYAPYAFEPGPGQERDHGFCGLAGDPR